METKTRIVEFGHPLYMGMFSDDGNMMVFEATSDIICAGVRGSLKRPGLRDRIENSLKDIEEFHGEAFDTEVRSAVAARINKELCVPMKWIKIDYFFDDEPS